MFASRQSATHWGLIANQCVRGMRVSIVGVHASHMSATHWVAIANPRVEQGVNHRGYAASVSARNIVREIDNNTSTSVSSAVQQQYSSICAVDHHQQHCSIDAYQQS